MRNGEELTIDETMYTVTQTVTNRRNSTYENVLTLTVVNAATAGMYSCTVTNVLNVSESMSVNIGKPIYFS